jgi:2'-5' RNA ligase
VINDPPHFGKDDIKKVKKVFYEVVPKHKKFNIYFYRLLLFPNNLALMGTSDEGLDNIILNLDQKLKDAGFADDKIYSNKRYFFCNMTLARFSQPSNYFKHKVKELSRSLSFKPYLVDSVTLLTCNAVFKKRNILHTWYLK